MHIKNIYLQIMMTVSLILGSHLGYAKPQMQQRSVFASIAPLNIANYIAEFNLEFRPGPLSFAFLGGYGSTPDGDGWNGGARVRYYPFFEEYMAKSIVHNFSLGLETAYTKSDQEKIELYQRQNGITVGALLGYKQRVATRVWVDVQGGYQMLVGGDGETFSPVASLILGWELDWLTGKPILREDMVPNIRTGDWLEMLSKSTINGDFVTVKTSGGTKALYEVVLCRNIRNDELILVFINKSDSLKFERGFTFRMRSVDHNIKWTTTNPKGYLQKELIVIGAEDFMPKHFYRYMPADMQAFAPGTQDYKARSKLMSVLTEIAPTPAGKLGKLSKLNKVGKRVKKGDRYYRKLEKAQNQITETSTNYMANQLGWDVSKLRAIKNGVSQVAKAGLDLIAAVDKKMNPMIILDGMFNEGKPFLVFSSAE